MTQKQEPPDEKHQKRKWPKDFWRAFDGVPEDFERPDQIPQEREWVEE